MSKIKNIITSFKIAFKIIRCINCDFKNTCPNSVFSVFKGDDYEILIAPIKKG